MGRTDVYGTYDVQTGRVWQMKKSVTDAVVREHLQGKRPYGIYLLEADRVRAAAVDFDDDVPALPYDFVARAKHQGIPAYIERSKSKGYHAWVFFDPAGVQAGKVRLVLKMMLEEMGRPATEIFPKQDSLNGTGSYGNFINAPLYGRLVPSGRTVFLDPQLKPYRDQWALLERIKRVPASVIGELVEINELASQRGQSSTADQTGRDDQCCTFGLPPCAQRMLQEGVTRNQRVACFRLAVQLRKAGLPLQYAAAVLNAWALRNHPTNGKPVITQAEIEAQSEFAYRKPYRGCGCQDEAVRPFCDPSCRLFEEVRASG